MIPSVEGDFLLIFNLIHVTNHYLTVVSVNLVHSSFEFSFPRVIIRQLAKAQWIKVLYWQILIQRSLVIVEDMQDLLVKRLEHGFNVVNSLCSYSSISVWLCHSNLNIFDLFECRVNLLNAILFLKGSLLVFFMRKDSLLHLMRIQYVCPEGVFYLAAKDLNLVVVQELLRNDNLLAHLKLLFVFKRIISILIT
jgi:hypothetical protein